MGTRLGRKKIGETCSNNEKLERKIKEVTTGVRKIDENQAERGRMNANRLHERLDLFLVDLV